MATEYPKLLYYYIVSPPATTLVNTIKLIHSHVQDGKDLTAVQYTNPWNIMKCKRMDKFGALNGGIAGLEVETER